MQGSRIIVNKTENCTTVRLTGTHAIVRNSTHVTLKNVLLSSESTRNCFNDCTYPYACLSLFLLTAR